MAMPSIFWAASLLFLSIVVAVVAGAAGADNGAGASAGAPLLLSLI